jgi:putative RNA 2'-phosphotransferase
MPDDKRLSKFLALVLRHRPDDFGVTLDADGFTDADALFAVVQTRFGEKVTRADFERVVTTPASDGKQRYELVGGRVRARYGHNQRVTAVAYDPVTPPDVLYHGTPETALAAVRRDGLLPMKRQYVHMATTVERATSVASRHGTPVLLRVDAKAAHAAGVVFYQADDEHYLAAAVPAAFVVFPGDEVV